MKKISLVYFLSALFAFGQLPYPYPQPKPTNGFTPTNYLIRISQPVGPPSYNNFSPAVWDTDIGGGLQVRTNQADRMNARWLRYGAIVLDQTDRTYYAVAVIPGTTNLGPILPLFTMDGVAGVDTSIYNTNGALLDFRTVELNSKTLTFQGAGSFLVDATLLKLESGASLFSADNFNILARNQLSFKTPGTYHGTVSNGWVLTLMDRVTGLTEFVAPPAGGGTNGTPDTSIYLNDGTLLTDRKVSIAGQNLSFDGGGGGVVAFTNSATVHVGGTDVKLAPLQDLRLSTVKTRANTAKVGDVLTVAALVPGDDAEVEFSAISPITTIYTGNGSLTGNRTVSGAGFGLAFTNANPFSIHSENTTVSANTSLKVLTPDLNISKAPVGGVLTLLDLFGNVDYRAPQTNVNIYNSNGTLTTNRTVTGDNKNLTFAGINGFSATGQTVDLLGVTRLGLKTPSISAANPGYVLSLLDKTTGASEWLPDQNFYTTNGTLASDRSVNGSSRFLKVTNVTTLDLLGQNSTISGTLSLNVKTPNISSGTSTNGQVLTLIDKTTGRSEFVTPAAFPTIPPDTSIYNSDGTIVTTNGTRNVNLGTNTLYFNNALGTFSVNSVGRVNLVAKTNYVYALNEWIGGVVGPSPGKVAMVTANTVAGTAVNGQVLTLVDAAGSIIEYAPAFNLYSTNGTLAGNRTVFGGANNLGITNVNNLTLQAANLNFRTPGVVGGTVSGGYSLQLADVATGRVEFAPDAVGSGADGSIYLNDGSLATNRVVNQAGKSLDFTATGNRFAVNGATNLNLNGTNANFSFGGTVIQRAATKYQLETPRVVNLGAAALTNQVLMIAADGSADFQAFTPTGVDTSIYNGSGTQIGNTVVTGNNFDLTFTGQKSFIVGPILPVTTTIGGVNTTLSGTTTKMAGSSKLIFQTPANGSAANGQVLTRIASDGAGEWQAIPAATTLYSGNGALLSDRTVDLNNKDLNFVGNGTHIFQVFNPGVFSVYSPTNSQYASNEFLWGSPIRLKLSAPSMNAGANGKVLTVVDAANALVDLQPSLNLYTANGTLTGTRAVGLGGNPLTFNGPGAFTYNSSGSAFAVNSASSAFIEGATTTLRATTSMKIQTPKTTQVIKPSVGDVLTFQASDGTAEFDAPSNLYTRDGYLVSDRLVSGLNRNLVFSGMNALTIDGQVTTINGHSRINMVTPGISTGVSIPGYVLTLIDSLGKSEWAPVQSPATLYTANGALLSHRTVTMGGNNLNFQGPGAWSALMSGGAWGVDEASSIILKAQASGTVTLEVPSSGQIRVKTPLVSGGSPTIGAVLTLQDLNGRVEFATPPTGHNIYNWSDSLTSDRTVNGAGRSLNFANMSTFQASGGIVDIAATTRMSVRPPGYTTAANFSVLTLIDNTTGQSEFRPAPGGLNVPMYFSATAVIDLHSNDGTDPDGGGPQPPGPSGIPPEITVTSTTPAWPYSTNNLPLDGTRLVLHLNATVADEFNRGTIAPRMTMPGDISGSLMWLIRDANFVIPGPGTIRDGMVMDLVFDRNLGGIAQPEGGRLWAFMNNTLELTDPVYDPPGAGLMAPKPPPIPALAPAAAAVTTVSYVGVVDTQSGLADAPLTFKKISTLGVLVAGDGNHADFFLTAYDPSSTVLFVRSNVDPNKMWKQLVAH